MTQDIQEAQPVLYRNRSKSPSSRVSGRPLAVGIVLAALVAGALFVGAKMLLASSPKITLAKPITSMGRHTPVVVQVADTSGIRAVKMTVTQDGKETTVLDQSFDPPKLVVDFQWTASQDKAVRLAEGPGKLRIEARNASWGGFMKGRSESLEQEFTARLVPPRIEVLTNQHYVNQGGADMVVYKVVPASAESGVVVGDYFFKGFPLPGATDPAMRFAIFALPYELPATTPVRLRARDEAGNEALTGFWLKVFPKKFRSRDIPVDDTFLNKVVPEILSQSPQVQDQGEIVKSYLTINRDLRKENNERLYDLAGKSEPSFLWKEPFQQLGNSQVEAQFADHRRYIYNGQEIDEQDHLGFDLATTSHAPISASNDGRVVMAEFFGIYGNCVVVDHGFGLLSLYGHLSTMSVGPGDTVTRGQTIGNSGATGLAGGDHLHYSMILQRAQVDAREWWDPHWLQDRLFAKLQQFGQPASAGTRPTTATASPAAPGRKR